MSLTRLGKGDETRPSVLPALGWNHPTPTRKHSLWEVTFTLRCEPLIPQYSERRTLYKVPKNAPIDALKVSRKKKETSTMLSQFILGVENN